MKTTLYITRHGQTEASAKGYVQGRGLNVPLIAEGREQARKLSEGLKNLKFDRIFTSTAIRSIDTANIIRANHKDVPVENIFELNERSKGEAEGMDKSDFKLKYPDVIEAWKREEDVRVAGGENYEDVRSRVVPVLEKHISDFSGKTLLYVLHGNVIRALLGYILDIPFSHQPRIQQSYCALNIVSYEHERKRWTVEVVNRVF